MITIRPIREEDNEKIYQIIRESLESFSLDIPGTAYFDPYLNKLYEYYQGLSSGEYWVLLINDRVIGGVGIGPFGDYKNIAELQKYYIIEEYQGKGLGRKLYLEAESFAKNQGYERLYIETSDKLDTANQVYERFGFQPLTKPLKGSEHGLMNRWFIKEL